jgi:hypothetical protein
MADDLRRLIIEIGGTYTGLKGLSHLDRDFDKILGKNKSLAAAAKMQADAQIREATRSATAIQKINDRISLSNRRMEELTTRQAWAASRGRIQAYQSVTAAIGRENDKILAMQKTLEREQILSAQRVAAAQAASSRATTLARTGMVASGLGLAGTGLIGAGAVGLGAGILAGRSASRWQTMVSQNVANSPMTPAERRAFQRLAFGTATRTGARPEDVFYALRLGSEMQLSGPQDRRYLQSALALGLPTGGSAAVAPSLQAIATVGHNFPQYARNPRAIANMLLATVQQSAGGINVQQLTENIPSVLAMAGHIGGKSSLADALGAYAALSQTGISAPEISTQMMNFLKVLQSGTARPGSLTNKTLEALRTQRGINLFSDFSQQGLADKGLGGVLTDIRNANLSQKTLLTLFPNMRGTLAALGLTGNQYQNFMRVQPQIAGAPGQNLIGRNMQNYLGLSSTQMEKLNQQLHILAITTGTQLLPAFNELMKDAIIPGAKEVAKFTKENRDLITELIKLSPWIIGVGVGLKGLSGLAKLGGILTTLGADADIASGASATTGIKGLSANITELGKRAVIASGLIAVGIGLLELDKKNRETFGDKVANILNGLGPMGHALAIDLQVLHALGIHTPLDKPVTHHGSVGGIGPGTIRTSRPLSSVTAPAGYSPPVSIFGLTNGGRAGQFSQPFYRNGRPAAQSWYGGNNPQNLFQWHNPPGGVAFHYDIPGYHKPFYLPGSKNMEWKVVGIVHNPAGAGGTGGNGWTVTWQGPNGATFTTDEFSEIPKGLHLNSTRRGGTYAGRGTDHIHISGNQKALNVFDYIATGGSRTRIVPNPRGAPAGIRRDFPKVAGYWPQIVAAAKKAGVDPYVLASLMASESSGDINAKATWNPYEKAWDYGLFQYGPPEAASVGGQYGPHISAGAQINTAAAYLAKVGLGAWNGPAEAKTVMARAMGWKGAGAGPGPSAARPAGAPAGGGVNVNLGRGAPLTPLQMWTNRTQGDVNVINQMLGRWGWPANTPMSRIKNEGRREMIAPWYKAATYAFAQEQIAQINQYPISEERKAAMRKDVWHQYYSGALSKELFPSAKGAKAGQRPTTPRGWSQWYGAQASAIQGDISTITAMFPGADLTHPSARQRAVLLPLLLGTKGHPGLFKDLLRETLSLDRSIYAGQPHIRAMADRAAWGAYHRELRHPFAFFQSTRSATGSQITPVQVVGSNKQLGVAEEHLKVAKEQLAEQKKTNHQNQQQIKHLERVINKLVHWINHHGGHVNVANDYSGVAVTGTSGHP